MTADDVRTRAVEAGARAFPPGWPAWDEEDIAAAVVDAVEPIIRADERVATLDRWLESPHMDRALEVREAEVRERLRAQVEVLHNQAVQSSYRYAIEDVLALLDGEPNG
jgi:hypothetical protein